MPNCLFLPFSHWPVAIIGLGDKSWTPLNNLFWLISGVVGPILGGVLGSWIYYLLIEIHSIDEDLQKEETDAQTQTAEKDSSTAWAERNLFCLWNYSTDSSFICTSYSESFPIKFVSFRVFRLVCVFWFAGAMIGRDSRPVNRFVRPFTISILCF